MSSPQMSDDDGIMSSTQSGTSSAHVESQMVNGARWINNHKIQAVNGPVWKVSWADPHFGQVIATCSFDRKAIVFEETSADSNSETATVWTQRNLIVDCQASVIGVKFGPQREGLILALASVDGLVQIYQATSPWNLTVWVHHSKIKHLKSCTLTSISWSTPITLPTLLAVGANGGTLSEKTERFGLFELIHSANPESGKELIWRRIQDSCIEIHAPTAVYEVAFAPSVGRRYHTLAVATNQIRVIKIELPFASQFQSSANDSTEFNINEAAASKYQFSSQTVVNSGSVSGSLTADICYRLGWNALGTIFAASQGDGSVKLYKQNHFNQWICFSKLEAKPTSELTSSRVSRSLFPNNVLNTNSTEPVFGNVDPNKSSQKCSKRPTNVADTNCGVMIAE
ncbi:nucleoporin SEH1-like isoform X2 [Symsagittifera roscoffensis]|uniref:nucleoporin SEH1-like isoform X2 n=1 Tax=Symsagittifera roscoffensis TaxID=84072 RepID=UPI00307C0725